MNLFRWRFLTDRIEKAERDGNGVLRGRLIRRRERLSRRTAIRNMILSGR